MTSLYYWLFTVARWIITSLSYWLAVNCHLMNHCLSTCCRCQVFTHPSSSQAAFSPVRHTSPAMSINQSTNQCLYSHVSNKNTHGTRHDPESIHKHTRTDNERSSHVCAKHRIYYSKDEHCTYNNKLDKTQNAYRLTIDHFYYKACGRLSHVYLAFKWIQDLTNGRLHYLTLGWHLA